MKTITTALIVLLSISLSYSQPTPYGTKKQAVRSVNSIEAGKNLERNNEKESKPAPMLIEVKVATFNDQSKYIYPKLNDLKFKEKSKYQSIEKIYETIEKVGKDKSELNLVLEMSKNGLRLNSHSFAIDKKGTEIHYYIFEF